MWTGNLDHIRACQRRGDCDPASIARLIGNRCEDLEAEADFTAWRRVTYRFCPMATHTDLIAWFCAPRTGKDVPTLVYLGDREIINGKRQTWDEQHTRKCPVASEGEDLTYEPYALMTAKPRPGDMPRTVRRRLEIAELVQRRVYEFFSFRTLAQAKFDTYFLGPRKDRTMSPALAYLFLLNGVEEERLFTYPTEETVVAR
jgi:hypothetical protein